MTKVKDIIFTLQSHTAMNAMIGQWSPRSCDDLATMVWCQM